MTTIFDPHPQKTLENNDEGPESLFIGEPYKDPYSSDNETGKEKNRKRINERYANYDNMFWAHINGTELKQLLKFTYIGVDSEININDASVENLLVEAFKFMYPNGVPNYFVNTPEFDFTSEISSWKEACPLIWKKFKDKKHVKWLFENYSFDYMGMRMLEYYRLEDQLQEAQSNMFRRKTNGQSKESTTKDDHVYQAVNLAFKFHALFYHLTLGNQSDTVQKSKDMLSMTHGIVKGVLYGMMNFITLWVDLDGAASFEFFHANLPKCGKGGNMKVKPDGTLSFHVSRGAYPYAVLEVHGPENPEILSLLISTESGFKTSHVFDSPESHKNESIRYKLDGSVRDISATHHNVERRGVDEYHSNERIRQNVQNMSLNNDEKCNVTVKCDDGKRVGDKIDYSLRKTSVNRDIEKDQIIAASPINPKLKLAFNKSTVRLPLEMYSLLLHQQKIIPSGLFPKHSEMSQTLGLFAMNEYVYIEKIALETRSVQQLASNTIRGDLIGPRVYLAKWCFDLKKPNHRMALLCFLYCYREIVSCDKLP